jgi:proteasome lid subunit RPN8/RPN11
MLTITTSQLAWLCAAYPHEGVGLLLGTDDGVVTQYVPARNMALLPRTQFVLDPQAWLDADVLVQRHGWQVLALVHSHPDALARPSPHDIQAGAVLGIRLRMLIAQVGARGIIEVTAWRWDGATYHNEPLLCH